VKLLRTIRLDASDTFVFERAAEPGEWAVPGTFAFASRDVASLAGKQRVAFRSGFLGIQSLGWSTLAEVVEVSEAERAAAVALLAQRLIGHFGAPDMATATAAAEEEVAFAASLSEHPHGTAIGLMRKQESGSIRESFRTLVPGSRIKPQRAFTFMEAADEEETPAEDIDLLALAREKHR
jgi:hypothetical protein